LIGLGAWFLLRKLGVPLPPLANLWPIFPFLGGVGFLGAFVTGKSRDPGVVWPGTAGALLGLFFFCITLGPLEWEDMGTWWPVFPLIGGLAFAATWAAGKFRERGLLVPAAIAIGTGLVGFVFTLGWLRRWLDPVLEFSWPLLLIVIGLALVLRSLLRARKVSKEDLTDP
jgi:hypothetical protein